MMQPTRTGALPKLASWLAGAQLVAGAQTVALMNAPHYNGAVEAVDGRVFAWGGTGTQGRSTSVLEAYAPGPNFWTPRADLPAAAAGQTSFVLGGKLYSIGGETANSGQFSRKVHRYDPTTDTWTALNDFVQTTTEVMGAVVDGQAFVFGGRHGYGVTYPEVYRYAEAADVWTPRAPMPVPVMQAGVAVHGGRIYVFGGVRALSEQSREQTAKLQVYDPLADTWAVSDMPWTLRDVTAAVSESTALVFARYIRQPDGTYVRTAAAYRYAFASGAWSTADFQLLDNQYVQIGRLPVVADQAYFTDGYENGNHALTVLRQNLAALLYWDSVAPMNSPHYSGGAERVGDALFVWGGYVGNATGGLDQYDAAADAWTVKAALPAAAGSPASFALNGRVYSIGGERAAAGTFSRAVHRYTPATDTWEQLQDFPVSAWGMLGAVVDGQAYVFAGRHGYGPTYPEVYQYEEAADSWRLRAPMPIPVLQPGVAVYGGRLHVFGGTRFHSESDRETVAKLQVFDPATDTWTITDMPWALPQATAAVLEDHAYVFARDLQTPAGELVRNHQVYRYSFATGLWTAADLSLPETTYVMLGRLPVLGGYAYFTDNSEGAIAQPKVVRIRLASLFVPADEPSVSLALHAGVTVKGTVGKTYAIQVATTLNPPDWATVATITLTAPEQVWFDAEPASRTLRAYRAVGD
jgi:N-acetylneuraminic acid mutarotase